VALFGHYFSKVLSVEETSTLPVSLRVIFQAKWGASDGAPLQGLCGKKPCSIVYDCLFALCMSCCTAWFDGHAEYAA
jgi:hypothetical protein